MHIGHIADVLRPQIPACVPGPPVTALPRNVSTLLRLWRTFGLLDAQTLSALMAVVTADAAVFAMFRSDHLPGPTLDGLQGPPDSPAPATPHADSTCPWCHSVRDLPWLHNIHHLLLCPAGLERLPFFQYCSEMLLLTSDWPLYCCRLGILLAGLNIHPSALASSCTLSAPLSTDFLCLLADPLRLEDPPLGLPVANKLVTG
jgi:hypothetical protein